MKTRGPVAVAVLVVVVALVAARRSAPAPLPRTPAGALLGTLSVAPATAGGYHRSAFGPAWEDTDQNGCDNRDDVLTRDLTDRSYRGRTCVVVGGTLLDPYTGRSLTFVKADPSIQVDHVVALGDAWASGASRWPYARMLAFANDPLELLVVDGAQNQAKGDQDAAGWLPPVGRCAYVARQVAVKAKYGLSVTGSERSAMARVLVGCPDVVAPAGGTPTLAP